MRNASKNTIKRVMRKAKFDQEKYNTFFNCGGGGSFTSGSDAYFLFNDVGAQIYRMSKGKICNRK